MTTKQYRTAMGKTVDMGALMLQNEGVRAVGNMAANSRGDKVNSTNQVIDRKTHQINRQIKRQVASAAIPTTTSNAAARRSQQEAEVALTEELEAATEEEVVVNEVAEEVATEDTPTLQGGLAAAIAKAKTVQQTKLPTPRESAKANGVRKL